LGLLAAYRGEEHVFDDSRLTRGSLMADASVGTTIPLTQRWYIEPSVRTGYPHIWGIDLTAGYKFPLRQKTEYIEVIREIKSEIPVEVVHENLIETAPVYISTNEVLRRIVIPSVEFILFGPDIGIYNSGIDHDAQELNELVIIFAAGMLNEYPDLNVRIQGHANPVTTDPDEYNELMALSNKRANEVAAQLIKRGVSEEQIHTYYYGGTMTVTRDRAIWNKNRRVELIIYQGD